jgi:sigma-B regulation protein RsbU (phosphoserine phosphatase)
MTMFRATSSQSSDPAEVITIVNKALCKNNENALFVTLFYGVLDYHSGQLDYCLAGHNPPYLLKPGQSPVPLEGTQSMALGVDESVQFISKTITISKSAQLFAFTDGVTEAINRKDDLYTDHRLVTCLSSRQDTDPKPLISAVLDDVIAFADGADQADDITMLSVKLKGPQPDST